jgi:F0F1-type ATP synthase membrane subunit c/vacuolar-type H+-ATPase subunit K
VTGVQTCALPISIADNAGTGIEVSESNWNTVMYNNEVTGNGWGIDVESTMWIIDAATKVARNGVWFDGDIEIRSGGSLMVQDVSTFDYDGDELLVMEGGLLSASAQGKVAAAAINILAKKPDDWSKGMIFCITVEFYAILSLLASFLMILNVGR